MLPYLGVTSPARDYSSAEGLFAEPQTYQVISNYNYLSIVDAESKISFPYTSADYFHYGITGSKDNLLTVQKQQKRLAKSRLRLSEIETECNRFIMKQNVASHKSANAGGILLN